MSAQKLANRVLLLFCCVFVGSVLIFLVGIINKEWHEEAKEGFVAEEGTVVFPRPLKSYGDVDWASVKDILINRIVKEPLNLIATIIFLLAIIHSFFTSKINKIASDYVKEQQEKKSHMSLAKQEEETNNSKESREHTECRDVNFKSEALHYLGEIELVFGMWSLPLIAAIVYFYNWNVAVLYLDSRIFTEVLFVIVIMSLAASRPILHVAEKSLHFFARLGNGSPAAWWLTILTVTPLLGSFITEPGAMTIAAILLAKQFYYYRPSTKFAYATLGLLFVNISVGGVLTNFAAPVILMVAHPWHWSSTFMLTTFGWKAVIGVLSANLVYFLAFKSEFSYMEHERNVQGLAQSYIKTRAESTIKEPVKETVPFWVSCMHLLFFLGIVANNEHPVIFIGIFIFYLGFHQATSPHQDDLHLRAPMLVGFFFAGLVIQGSMQSWWIAPIISHLGSSSLMVISTALTAFNDNAAITYMTTKIPDLTHALKYAVVAGAVTGGGLTIIANAPNPAGQVLLKGHFKYGISPVKLFLGALTPTIIVGLLFYFL